MPGSTPERFSAPGPDARALAEEKSAAICRAENKKGGGFMKSGGVEIVPVVYGRSVMPESMIFPGGAKDRFRPIVFMIYLIRIGKRLILADAGCETMPDFDMTDFIGPVRALAQLHIAPGDITDVVITHAHHDHIESVKYFTNAAIYIQQDEYENGKAYFTPALRVNTFDGGLDLGDGVRVVKIGGHSVGSCVVEITAGDKTYVIAGDECYQRECLDRRIPTASAFDSEKSREFINKYSSGKYTVLLCHDQ